MRHCITSMRRASSLPFLGTLILLAAGCAIYTPDLSALTRYSDEVSFRETSPSDQNALWADEEVDLGDDGHLEGPFGDPHFQAVSVPEALLGQPFLGAWVLCRHRRSERGDDPQVRQVPGEEGASRRTIETAVLTKGCCGAARACILWVQALSHSLSRQSKVTSSGRGFLLR